MPVGAKFGSRSTRNLATVHPALVEIAREALLICTLDFFIESGGRTLPQQRKLYAQGRTAPGPIVTWVRPEDGKHVIRKTDAGMFGLALDAYPFPYNSKDPLSKFDQIADAFKLATGKVNARRAAKGLPPVELRWGADWDGDNKRRERGETDNPHFELKLAA